MNLFQLTEVDPIYRKAFGNTDIKQFQVYTAQSDHIGKVVDVLSNETGKLYYLVVKIGSWLTSKQVLLPLEQFQIDPAAQRIYITGMSKAQAENLPIYDPTESGGENFRSVTREAIAPLENSIPLEASAPLDTPLFIETRRSPLDKREQIVAQSQPTSEVSTERLHTPPNPPAKTIAEETIRLLGERLVVESRKRKIGEVIIRKEVETQIVEIPIRREKLIVEQVSPEPRQLASIDLGQGELTGVELAELASSALKPIAGGKFSSAETARQFLEEVAQQPEFRGTKVQLTFEDTKVQTAYQNWLERYLANPT